MKMIAINGSPRTDGKTSEALEHMSAAAIAKGYEVERLDLVSLDFKDCQGCRECKMIGHCVQDDDMTPVYERILEADHILLASPVYMGSETGMFKSFVDRLYAFLEPKEGGGFDSSLPSGKAATVVLVCGSPDGHIIYHHLMNRFTSVMKGLLGMEDFGSFIVPGMHRVDELMESATFEQNLAVFQERL